MNDIFFQDEINFDHNGHVYRNNEGKEYTSVTRLLKSIQVPFNRELMSYQMAKGISKDTGANIIDLQKDILDEWNTSLSTSSVHGDMVHQKMEEFVEKGTYDKEFEGPAKFITSFIMDSYRYYTEKILFSHEYEVAGRGDLIIQRQKTEKSLFDFFDYKSNLKKGIRYDSTGQGIKSKHYNRMLLPPFDYLEDCNYTIYSLQLSLYAFLAMTTFNIQIGKLGIIFVGHDKDSGTYSSKYIPVPFMKLEAQKLCELNLTRIFLKDIPELVEEKKEDKPGFDINNVTEDWE